MCRVNPAGFNVRVPVSAHRLYIGLTLIFFFQARTRYRPSLTMCRVNPAGFNVRVPVSAHRLYIGLTLHFFYCIRLARATGRA